MLCICASFFSFLCLGLAAIQGCDKFLFVSFGVGLNLQFSCFFVDGFSILPSCTTPLYFTQFIDFEL